MLLAAFYWPWLTGAQTFYFKDCTHFFEPLCSFIGRAFAEGRIPLWNPYSYAGMPEAAISSPGIFYPLNWIFGLVPYSLGVAIIMLVSQLICGAGVFVLIEALGWGVGAAFVGASIVANSGYLFSLASNYTLVATAAWFPWCLVAVHKRWTVGLALFVFMFIAAGRPEIMAPGMVLCAAYAFFARRENLADLVKAVTIGVLLAMPVLLPSLEWLPLSRRSEGLNPEEILMFSANWFDLISMVAFQPLGDLQLTNAPLRQFVYPNNLEPYFQSAFVGPIALLLAIAGLARPGGRLYWVAVAALIGGTILSLGSNVPFFDNLVGHIPGFALLRFPSKILFFTVFMVAMFAARGVRLIKLRLLDTRILFGIFCVALGLGALASVMADGPYRAIAVSCVVAMGIGVVGAACIHIVSSVGTATKLVMPLGAAVVGTLLFNAFAYLRAGGPPDFFTAPSAVAQRLREVAVPISPMQLRFVGLFLEKFTSPPPVEPAPNPVEFTIRTAQYSRQLLRPFTNMDCRLRSSFGFEGAMVGEYFYLFSNCYLKSTQSVQGPSAARTDVPLARFIRMMATPFVITQDYRFAAARSLAPIPALDATMFDLVWRDQPLNARIYRVRNPMPHAYLSYNWTIKNRDEVIQQIYDDKSNWDPFDTTLVETAGVLAALQDGKSVRAIEAVPVSEVTAEKIVCNLKSDAPAFLVLCDQYYPGWSASVDGKAVPIYRCNGFVRGVTLEAGNHLVEFNYRPYSFYGGLILAFLGLMWGAYLGIRNVRLKHNS